MESEQEMSCPGEGPEQEALQTHVVQLSGLLREEKVAESQVGPQMGVAWVIQHLAGILSKGCDLMGVEMFGDVQGGLAQSGTSQLGLRAWRVIVGIQREVQGLLGGSVG